MIENHMTIYDDERYEELYVAYDSGWDDEEEPDLGFADDED